MGKSDNDLATKYGKDRALVLREAEARGASQFAIEEIKSYAGDSEAGVDGWREAMSFAEEREESISALAEEIKAWMSGEQPFISHDSSYEAEEVVMAMRKGQDASTLLGLTHKMALARTAATVAFRVAEMRRMSFDNGERSEREDGPARHAVKDFIDELKETLQALEEIDAEAGG